MTGLSIKTLAEALCEVAGNWGRFSNDMDTEEGLKDFRHERDFAFKLRRALCAKSERYEALERVAEAAVAHRLAEIAEEAVDWDLDTPIEKEDEAHAAFVRALGALVDTKQRLDAAIAPLMEVTE